MRNFTSGAGAPLAAAAEGNTYVGDDMCFECHEAAELNMGFNVHMQVESFEVQGDFSQTNTYSDLDTTFWQAKLYGRYYVKKSLYLTADYQYLDLQDDAPYLCDTSGSVDIYNFGVGWSFF